MTLILNQIDIASLKKAAGQLAAALPEAQSDLERAGAIQYFEYCFELSWKTLKRVLVAMGKETLNNPRSVFRDAGQNALIDDVESWLGFIEYRNKTVHTYEEQVAVEIFRMLPRFREHLDEMIRRLENLS